MHSRLRNATVASARLGAMTLASLILASVAGGWLYWLQRPTARWSGPRVIDALPLDELSGHSSISLVIFAVAMAIAGLFTGEVARLLRFDGFAIALSVGAGIGAWIYLTSAFSIFIVRQVSIDVALDATRDLQPIYLAAALFASAVALSARRAGGEQWLTRLVPAGVGLLGIATLLSATLPHSVGAKVPLGGMLTGVVSPLARTLDVSIGMMLLICARGLTRRGRRALALAVILVPVLLVGRIVDDFNIVALIAGAIVLISLIARREDFSNPGDPSTPAAGFLRVLSLGACAVAYGVVALVVNRIAAGLPVHGLNAVLTTFHALLIGAPRQSSLISADFGEWFPWSLRAIVALGLIWGATTWFAPWRHRPTDQAESRRHARQLVSAWGGDTLAPFALRHDKALYFYPDGSECLTDTTTLIAYRIVRGVAIVSGDPIGPIDQAEPAIAAFLAMCASRGWRFALLGASDRLLTIYQSLGLRTLYHGDEAVIDTATFSLAGGGLKSVRQAVHRVDRKGFHAEICTGGDLAASVRHELSALEERWLAGGERKGFVMELDELFRLDGDEVLFVIGRAPEGDVVGFLEIARIPASASLSLSAMPRAVGAPNGLNAFLIVAAIEWAREHAFAVLSLNFSPAARLLSGENPCSGRQRILRRMLLISKRVLGLQLDNLLNFNRRFAPRWQPRYVVVKRFRDLPRVVVAAMAAERYLPFADFLRGRDRPEIAQPEVPTAAVSSNR